MDAEHYVDVIVGVTDPERICASAARLFVKLGMKPLIHRRRQKSPAVDRRKYDVHQKKDVTVRANHVRLSA